MMTDFILGFGVLFLVIVGICLIVKLLKQPIIIGYVLSGIIFSLYVMEKSFQREEIIILAELGITFLLFLMGLEFDLKSIKFLGKDLIIVSVLQSAIFFIFGLVLTSFFNFTFNERIYLSVLFMFGSTLLVAKWLEDKKEVSTLHGKIILGTLIIQDVIAVIILTLLSMLQAPVLSNIYIMPLGAVALLALAFVLSRYILNPILKFASRYPELLFILSLGVCFLFVEIAPLFKYSTTLGAFIAGITLANTEYKHVISGKLKPLINFFNMLFFVGLGFQMQFQSDMGISLFILISILLCLILKPIVTYLTLRWRGYDTRTSYLSGMYLAQFSEFGIIIIVSGISIGAISSDINFIAIICVIISMIISSYFIKYERSLYVKIAPFLSRFEKKIFPKQMPSSHNAINSQVIIFCYHELGEELTAKLHSKGKHITIIENDPENISHINESGLYYVFGSAADPGFFDHFEFHKTELVVSNITDIEINKKIIVHFKKINPKCSIIVSARTLNESMELYESKADYVMYQAYLHEQQMAMMIDNYAFDFDSIIEKRIKDISIFKKKQKLIRHIRKEHTSIGRIHKLVHKIKKRKFGRKKRSKKGSISP